MNEILKEQIPDCSLCCGCLPSQHCLLFVSGDIYCKLNVRTTNQKVEKSSQWVLGSISQTVEKWTTHEFLLADVRSLHDARVIWIGQHAVRICVCFRKGIQQVLLWVDGVDKRRIRWGKFVQWHSFLGTKWQHVFDTVRNFGPFVSDDTFLQRNEWWYHMFGLSKTKKVLWSSKHLGDSCVSDLSFVGVHV